MSRKNVELYSDAAKRASDIVNLHLAANSWDEIRDKFVAIRLSDGGYDGTLYDNKRDAVRHQSDERLCAYVCFRNLMAGASPKEMQVFLDMNRKAYDAGMRFHDPDDAHGGKDLAPEAPLVDYVRRARVAAMSAQMIAALRDFPRIELPRRLK